MCCMHDILLQQFVAYIVCENATRWLVWTLSPVYTLGLFVLSSVCTLAGLYTGSL